MRRAFGRLVRLTKAANQGRARAPFFYPGPHIQQLCCPIGVNPHIIALLI